MITKNSTGANISNAMISLIGGNARTFKARLLLGAGVLSCDIISLRVSKGMGENFTPGSLFIPYLEATIANCSTSLEGEDITLQIGMDVNGTDEWLVMGKFTVAEAKESQGEINITAVGYLNSKCGTDVTINAGTTIANAITAITNVCGLSVSYKGITPSGTITTGFTRPCREALGAIAQLLGGGVTEDNDGGIVIAKHMSGSSLTVTSDRCVDPPEFAEADATEEGYTFRPGLMDLTLGDPRLEPWDYLSVTEGNDTFSIPCLRLTHSFDGGLQTLVDCTRPSSTTETLKGAIEVKIEGLEVVAEEAHEMAKETNEYFWFTSQDTGAGSGAHITEIPQEDFLADPSNGGGNLLARSNGIAVRDGLTELAVFGADGIKIGAEGGNSVEVTQNRFVLNNADNIKVLEYSTDGTKATEMVKQYIVPSRTVYDVSSTEIFSKTINFGDGGVSAIHIAFEDFTFSFASNVTSRTVTQSIFDQTSISDDKLSVRTSSIFSMTNQEGKISVTTGSGTVVLTFKFEFTSNSVIISVTASAGGIVTSVDMDLWGLTYDTELSAPSFLMGTTYEEVGGYSLACGKGVNAVGDNQVVIGRYNYTDTDGEKAFIIGNGLSDTVRGNAFSVNWNGNVITHGTIYKNYDEEVVSASQGSGSDSVSIGNSTSFADTGVDEYLDPGLYILVASISFPTGTGRRGLRWYYGGDTNWAESAVSHDALTGANTRMQVTRIIKVNSGVTMKIQAFQNSGSALTCDVYYRYIKLA